MSENRRAEGQVQCQFLITDIISYWLNENRILKYIYSISNQESSIKYIWTFISFDKKPLLRGWKLLELKWGKTAFGEPNNKGQQMISTPPKVLPF